MPTPARTPDGRLLDVPEDASPEEIAESIARRDAEDSANRAALRRIGIDNGAGFGWLGWR